MNDLTSALLMDRYMINVYCPCPWEDLEAQGVGAGYYPFVRPMRIELTRWLRNESYNQTLAWGQEPDVDESGDFLQEVRGWIEG